MRVLIFSFVAWLSLPKFYLIAVEKICFFSRSHARKFVFLHSCEIKSGQGKPGYEARTITRGELSTLKNQTKLVLHYLDGERAVDSNNIYNVHACICLPPRAMVIQYTKREESSLQMWHTTTNST